MLKLLFFSVWIMFHPVHVTLTSIEYVPETVDFKMFVRMYFDDFLLDCRLNGGVVEEDGFSGANQANVDILEKYVNDKIVLTVNNKKLIARLENVMVLDNEISMNLYFKNSKKPGSLTVKNLIMTGLYSDQANMVIVRVNKFEEGVKLTSDITEKTFKIK